MSQITVRYIVYNRSGGGVRHHHFTSQNNIIDEANGQAASGDIISAIAFQTQFYQGQTVSFAFMSVHGAADGNHLYTSPGIQQVKVGSSDVAILAVYAPPGGGIGDGTGGPGVWVDAFNVDVGDFSDSDFIQVLSPPTPPDSIDIGKSQYANAEGVVSTLNDEILRAFSMVDGAPFLEWKKIVPSELIINARDVPLSAVVETGEIWLAFYQTVSTRQGIVNVNATLKQTLGRWVDDDTCGSFPHHIGPIGPNFRINVESKSLPKMTAANRKKLGELVKAYPALAAAAYSQMGKVTNILQGITAILKESDRK